VLLAALLLKLGGYGFMRFTIGMLPYATMAFQDGVYFIAVAGVVSASLVAICQQDLKRIVAYSSIAHMNVTVIGLFSLTHFGMDGAFFLMLGHGIVSSALFFCVGILYNRHHTRAIKHYSGLAQIMPVFAFFFLLFTLGNMGFPGTSNFLGELLIFSGTLKKNTFIMLAAGVSIVFSAVYSIWVYNRLFFGTLKTEKQNTTNYADVNRSEFFILLYLAAGMIILGLSSSYVTLVTYEPINFILQGYY